MPDHKEILSGPIEGARAGIIEALGGANANPDFRQDKAALESYGYRLVTVEQFNNATDVPAGSTREVVRRVIQKHGGTFVVYHPQGDDQGWLLVGDDPASLARETVAHCQENESQPAAAPAQASLF